MLELNKIYNQDCYEVLKQLDDCSVDLLLQDTPFGVTQNEWDIKPDLSKMWKEWKRVTKPAGAMIFFATQPFTSELILSNIEDFRYDLIWYKSLCSGFLNAKKMPLRNHESIVVFYRKLPTYNPQMGVGIRKKGKNTKITNGTNYGKMSNIKATYDDEGTRYPQSILDFTNGDRTNESDHPTQKPVDLIRYLIKTYSNEGDLVFDGYMGSGTTAHAAVLEKRNFLGAETDEKYFVKANERLSLELSQPKLF